MATSLLLLLTLSQSSALLRKKLYNELQSYKDNTRPKKDQAAKMLILHKNEVNTYTSKWIVRGARYYLDTSAFDIFGKSVSMSYFKK